MKDKITILVATMSGTAEMLADELVELLSEEDVAANVRRMEDVDVDEIRAGLYLICSSTYGIGEVPANGLPMYDSLKSLKPDLTGVRYGVISLGDSLYPKTFCFGGKHFDELFSSLGAERVGQRLEHDSRSGLYPEEAAGTWLRDWIPLIKLLTEKS